MEAFWGWKKIYTYILISLYKYLSRKSLSALARNYILKKKNFLTSGHNNQVIWGTKLTNSHLVIIHILKVQIKHYNEIKNTSFKVALLLNSLGREKDLRQDQGVFGSIVVIQRGLLGVHLIVDDGQLAQPLHKCVCFWRENCRQTKTTIVIYFKTELSYTEL